MPKVNIKGVILPENFWLDENVATLADFTRELGEAGDELELYIDSPGGDVMTANSMSTLIAEWCLQHPSAKCSCVIGGLCASAAANIVAKLPKAFDVECFEDTLIMYHSAYAMVVGGAGAMRDNAELIDLVNDIVIDKLISKTTLEPSRIKEAFLEGREMWLDGREAVACGLASSIRGGEADASVKTAVFEADNKAEAYRYAACVTNTIKQKMETRIMAEEEDKKPETPETEETQANAATTEAQEAEKKPCGECGDDDKKKDEMAEAQAQIDALKTENDALKAELDKLKATIAKYQPIAKPTSAPAAKTDWLSMIHELNAKHLPELEYAKEYTALKQAHPEEFEAFMKARTAR